MNPIVTHVRKRLKQEVDENTRLSSRRYFKESVKTYGVKTPVVNRIGREAFQSIQDRSRHEIWVLCESLWKSGYLEECLVACDWAYALRDRYEKEDFARFESWLDRYVSNWATCDTLCNHSVGHFVETHPEFVRKLKAWTTSDNRWKRRAAAVTLILPARHGLFLQDIFDIADRLLLDRDDLVQKGYGWMLKAASKPHENAVFDFVVARKADMPRTAYRYAIETMPTELKKRAMKKD